MDQKQVIELFMLRTGVSKELASKYLADNDGLLGIALIFYQVDKIEGKVK
ncbi:hypothetical protein RM407_001537 [Enterobacter kobei]|nr:hypothetical protein [Enterobacter kobei]